LMRDHIPDETRERKRVFASLRLQVLGPPARR
jgi:hypothetical protein